MTTAYHYAKALYQLLQKNPAEGSRYLKNLRELLGRRSHEKLLSRIYSEYLHLETAKTRGERYQKVTPERRQTQKLIELYRALLRSGS